jgi:hypothetical protein
VDHVSRPLLIGLVAIIGLAGAWFAVLRPKPTEGEGGPAPTATQGTALPQVATPPAGQAAPGPAAPAHSASDRSAPILRELDSGKVAVLVFWNPRAADDRAVRRAVGAVGRRHGRVTVHSSRIARVGDYAAITQGVEVLQTPTVLVIGPNRRARTIVGFTDTREIEQLVGDLGGGKTTSGYRAVVGESCGRLANRLSADLRGTANLGTALTAAGTELRSTRSEAAGLKVPARYRSFHQAWLTYLTGVEAAVGKLRTSVDAGKESSVALQEYFQTVLPLDRSMTQSAGKADVTCAA